MTYYKVRSSHWPMDLEFKSKIPLAVGQCFRIKSHSGDRLYPTRFKVLSVSSVPEYKGPIIELYELDLNVEMF